MSGGVFGGGIMFAALALLWVAVIAPSWMKKREFRTSEQNAARLQRTLRVLAETAEVPGEHRVEATARQALAHERMLSAARKRQEAERAAEVNRARAEQILAEQDAKRAKKRKDAAMRTTRLNTPLAKTVRVIAAASTLLGLLGVIAGAVVVVVGAGAAVLGWSTLALFAGLGGLIVLAPGRAKARASSPEQHASLPRKEHVEPETPSLEESHADESDRNAAKHAAAQARALERSERARAMARARAAARVQAANERANQPDSILLSAAQSSTPRQTDRPVEQPQTTEATPAQRLSRMGVVGDTTVGAPSIDEVLARRRNAG